MNKFFLVMALFITSSAFAGPSYPDKYIKYLYEQAEQNNIEKVKSILVGQALETYGNELGIALLAAEKQVAGKLKYKETYTGHGIGPDDKKVHFYTVAALNKEKEVVREFLLACYRELFTQGPPGDTFNMLYYYDCTVTK